MARRWYVDAALELGALHAVADAAKHGDRAEIGESGRNRGRRSRPGRRARAWARGRAPGAAVVRRAG